MKKGKRNESELGRKKDREWVKRCTAGLLGEETAIGRERTAEERVKYSIAFHCPDLDGSPQIELNPVSRDNPQ